MKRTLFCSRVTTTALALVVASVPLIARADDVIFGGAPGAGMAGAGLALPAFVGRNNPLNPALLAWAKRDVNFNWPYLGYHLDGITESQLSDQLGGFGNGGLSTTQEQQNVHTSLLNGEKQFGIQAGLGFQIHNFALNGLGEANVVLEPNAALSNWANTGGTGTPPADSQMDAYGLAYAQESLGYGDMLKLKNQAEGDHLALGAAVKVVQAWYAHKIINQYTASGSGSLSGQSTDGADITEGGGSNDKQKNGVGLDVGGIYSSSKLKTVSFGVVVENAVEPNIKFDRQLANSATIVSDDIDIFKRAVDAGLGWIPDKKLHLAADMIDIGNHADREELRAGADYKIIPILSLRAGVSSYSGVDFGVSIFGIALAYSPKTQLTVGTSYRF